MFSPSGSTGPCVPSLTHSQTSLDSGGTQPEISSDGSAAQVSPNHMTSAAISKIEQVLESILDSVGKSKELSIPFRRRPTRASRSRGSARAQSAVSFPGKSQAEAKLFTQVLSILELSHRALLSGTLVTKRNIFYQNCELFQNQRVVNDLVDDIAYTLGLGRDSLNIVAASVGLVCGHIDFAMADGSFTHATNSEQGVAIPPLRTIKGLQLSYCNWILVIEKEATFRTLAASGYWNSSVVGPGAIITSKGYPTLVTRLFLNHVTKVAPLIPIYGLVDYDPHGIRIFRTYKYGSMSLEHENDTDIPEMQWLGIRSQDLQQHNVVCDDAMPLTERDRKTAMDILKSILCGESPDHSTLQQCREVQVMLMLNVKAEIQAVDDHGDLTSWLNKKLGEEQNAN